MVAVNYLAILVCGFVAMGLGTLWYGPLFGQAWMKGAGISPDAMEKMKADPKMKQKMMRSYGIMFIGSLLTAFVLAHSLVFASTYMQISGVMAGFEAAIWNWLGFVAPVTIGMVLWEQKTVKYWLIVSGYSLVYLLICGTILALWV